jgi:hypothetical protein
MIRMVSEPLQTGVETARPALLEPLENEGTVWDVEGDLVDRVLHQIDCRKSVDDVLTVRANAVAQGEHRGRLRVEASRRVVCIHVTSIAHAADEGCRSSPSLKSVRHRPVITE